MFLTEIPTRHQDVISSSASTSGESIFLSKGIDGTTSTTATTTTAGNTTTYAFAITTTKFLTTIQKIATAAFAISNARSSSVAMTTLHPLPRRSTTSITQATQTQTAPPLTTPTDALLTSTTISTSLRLATTLTQSPSQTTQTTPETTMPIKTGTTIRRGDLG